MVELPLRSIEGHLFVELEGKPWLLDTGSPVSFGEGDRVVLAGREFPLEEEGFLGLTVSSLAEFTGVACAGLLGGDVLGEFDHLVDVPGGRHVVSAEELDAPGTDLPLDEMMGVPIVPVTVAGRECGAFFDTGAQLSYWQGDGLESFPAQGSVEDFYPGVGRFTTETYRVEFRLGGLPFSLRCGRLPGLLGATLLVAGVEAIVGNEVLRDRPVAWFPRRGILRL